MIPHNQCYVNRQKYSMTSPCNTLSRTASLSPLLRHHLVPHEPYNIFAASKLSYLSSQCRKYNYKFWDKNVLPVSITSLKLWGMRSWESNQKMLTQSRMRESFTDYFELNINITCCSYNISNPLIQLWVCYEIIKILKKYQRNSHTPSDMICEMW